MKEDDDPTLYGPALPPHLAQRKSQTFGPSLPAIPPKPPTAESSPREDDDDDDDGDDGDAIGPMPPGQDCGTAQKKLDERALEMRISSLQPAGPELKVREEWMLELPPAQTVSKLGLGPRKFRSKEGPDMSDRSSWTDTPGGKKGGTEKDLRKEAESESIRKRDEEQAKEWRKLEKKKKRKSLMDLHKEKMKEAKKNKGTGERQPFNRETDLKIVRLSGDKKDAALKKMNCLDSRFSQGEAKFL